MTVIDSGLVERLKTLKLCKPGDDCPKGRCGGTLYMGDLGNQVQVGSKCIECKTGTLKAAMQAAFKNEKATLIPFEDAKIMDRAMKTSVLKKKRGNVSLTESDLKKLHKEYIKFDKLFHYIKVGYYDIPKTGLEAAKRAKGLSDLSKAFNRNVLPKRRQLFGLFQLKEHKTLGTIQEYLNINNKEDVKFTVYNITGKTKNALTIKGKSNNIKINKTLIGLTNEISENDTAKKTNTSVDKKICSAGVFHCPFGCKHMVEYGKPHKIDDTSAFRSVTRQQLNSNGVFFKTLKCVTDLTVDTAQNKNTLESYRKQLFTKKNRKQIATHEKQIQDLKAANSRLEALVKTANRRLEALLVKIDLARSLNYLNKQTFD